MEDGRILAFRRSNPLDLCFLALGATTNAIIHVQWTTSVRSKFDPNLAFKVGLEGRSEGR